MTLYYYCFLHVCGHSSLDAWRSFEPLHEVNEKGPVFWVGRISVCSDIAWAFNIGLAWRERIAQKRIYGRQYILVLINNHTLFSLANHWFLILFSLSSSVVILIYLQDYYFVNNQHFVPLTLFIQSQSLKPFQFMTRQSSQAANYEASQV